MSPIKASRRHLYPANWNELSLRIRQEAGDRCEWCGLCNRAVGYRYGNGHFRAVAQIDRMTVQRVLEDIRPSARGARPRLTRIVLTVHHRDGNPENNERGNLKALCQKCHLEADRALRAATVDKGADSDVTSE